MSNKAKQQYQARLDNQKAQLERHGNFAEVVIRTTPEGTDMINFARLWEHILVVADRQTRGYIAKSSRDDFDKTRQDFNECVDFMVEKLKLCIDRHNIDLTGGNFVSRIAQRYDISDKKRSKQPAADDAPKASEKLAEAEKVAKAPVAEEKAEKPAKEAVKPKAAPKPAAAPASDEVDGF